VAEAVGLQRAGSVGSSDVRKRRHLEMFTAAKALETARDFFAHNA